MSHVVRVCSLPLDSVDRLAFSRTNKQIELFLEIERKLTSDAATLADEVYTVIGSADVDHATRRLLISLRRDLHNLREIDPGTVHEILAETLLPDLRTRLSAWIEDRASLTAAGVEADILLAEESLEKAGILLHLASAPEFRRALTTASPAVLAELERWAASPERLPKKQKLARIAAYVLRATLKTSPFSFFTSSAPVAWAADGSGVRLDPHRQTHGVMEVDAEYLDRWARYLTNHEGLGSALLLRINPTVTRTDAGIEFLGRPPREPFITVPASTALERTIALIERHPASPRPEVERMLGEISGGRVAQARHYLTRLVEAGLVEAHLPVRESAMNWLGDCGALVSRHASAEPDGVGAALVSAGAAVADQVAVADVAGQRRRCGTVRRTLQTAAERTGDERLLTREPVLFENAVSSSPATLNRRHWQPVIDDLRTMLPWFGVLDPYAPKRLAAAALHAECFGAGSSVPMLTLYRVVCEQATSTAATTNAVGRTVRELFRQQNLLGTQRETASLRDAELPTLSRLGDLRREARALFDDADPAGPIQPHRLAELAVRWPEWLTYPESIDCYLQPVSSADRQMAVLNGVHSGYGRATARLRRISARPESYGEPHTNACSTDSLVAELTGRHGSTLNMRASTLPTEIAYPFAGYPDQQRRRLRLADLVAVHDAETGLVRLCDDAGRRVIPAHLGLMVCELLPPVARFLIQVFGTDWIYHPSALTFVPFHLLTEQRPIVSYPRTSVGTIVLRRAGWLAAPGQVPCRASSESDAAYLIRLHRWFREHGIPTRSFVRYWHDAADGAHLTQARLRNRSAKPFSLDLENWFTVAGFERLTERASMLLFEEQLPTAQDGALAGAKRFATEVVLEVNGGTRAHG